MPKNPEKMYANLPAPARTSTIATIAYWAVEASGNRLDYEQAKRLVLNNISDDFIIGPADVSDLLSTINQVSPIPLSQSYINQMNDKNALQSRIANINEERRATRIGGDRHIPKEIMAQIRPYIKSARRTEMDSRYRATQAIRPGEQELGYQRMAEMLTYLNDNRIAFTLSVDGRDSSRIMATLEEYDNMLVEVYNTDPREIGRVNTFKTIYSVDTGRGDERDLNAALKQHPAAVLDTLLNPGVTLTNIENIQMSSNSGMTNKVRMQRPSIGLSIFGTNVANSTTNVNAYMSQLEAYQVDLGAYLDLDNVNESTVDFESDDEREVAEEFINNSEALTDDARVNKPKRLDMLRARINSEMVPADPDDAIAQKIQGTLNRMGLVTQEINVNGEGVYEYKFINSANNSQEQLDSGMARVESAIIGGIRQLNEDGTYALTHNGKEYGTFVPGLRVYIDTQTGEPRVKSFAEIFDEKLHQIIVDQVSSYGLRNSIEAYTALDTLYSAGAYGVTIQKGINPPEIEEALIKTLLKRGRLPSEIIDTATTNNAENGMIVTDFVNEVDRFMRTKSIRVIPKEWYSVIDNQVTSIGKNQGGVFYLGSETTWTKDGHLIPGEGVTHAVSDVRNLPMFKETNTFDPVDRVIMSATQLLRNVPVTDANIALMEFGGHDVNDPFIISKAYAERASVAGHDGKDRPLKIGDKITDFHGNKGLITTIIDPDDTTVLWHKDQVIWADGNEYDWNDIFVLEMESQRQVKEYYDNMHEQMKQGIDISDIPPLDRSQLPLTPEERAYFHSQEFKANNMVRVELADLEAQYQSGQMTPEDETFFKHDSFYDMNYLREREIFKANPDLDVVVAPFSLLSRANMGLVREMQDNYQHQLNDANLPDGTTIPLNHISMGNISMMISDMDVEYKTSVYTDEAYEKGRGRKISHQLIMGMQALGLEKTLSYVFQDNQMNAEGWGQALDDIRMMGYDIDKNGVAGRMDMSEIYRKLDNGDKSVAVIQPNGKMSFKDQLDYAKNIQGADDIFLALPTVVTLRSGVQTQLLRVPTAQFDAAEKVQAYAAQTGVMGTHGSFFMNRFEDIFKESTKARALTTVPQKVAQLDDAIVAREFSKDKNVFKTRVYSARMPHSATAPLSNRPTGDLDTLYVSSEIYNNFKIDPEKGNHVLVWRDPILNTGGFVAMKVQEDPSLTGCALHYANDEPMKADRDGDSLGLVYIPDKEVQQELAEVASREWRLGDPLRNPEHYKSGLTQGLNLDAGLALMGEEGKLLKQEFNHPDTPMERVQEIYKLATRNNQGFGSYGLDIRSDEAVMTGLEKIIDSGAKGSSKSMDMVKEFYYGDRRTQTEIDQSVQDWTYALGGKVDFVGPAGTIQQKLIQYMRNGDINAALEISAGPTHGTLQVKHDPLKAKLVGSLVSKDLPNVFNGVDRFESRSSKNPKRLTKGEFTQQLSDILNNQMGLSYDTQIFERLANTMSGADGLIMTQEELTARADGLDMAAYSGVTGFMEAARQNKQFGMGPNNYMFQPPKELAAEHVLDKYAHQELPNRNYEKTMDELVNEKSQLRLRDQEIRRQKEIEKAAKNAHSEFTYADKLAQSATYNSQLRMQEDQLPQAPVADDAQYSEPTADPLESQQPETEFPEVDELAMDDFS